MFGRATIRLGIGPHSSSDIHLSILRRKEGGERRNEWEGRKEWYIPGTKKFCVKGKVGGKCQTSL